MVNLFTERAFDQVGVWWERQVELVYHPSVAKHLSECPENLLAMRTRNISLVFIWHIAMIFHLVKLQEFEGFKTFITFVTFFHFDWEVFLGIVLWFLL